MSTGSVKTPNTHFKNCLNKDSLFLSTRLIDLLESILSKYFSFDPERIKKHRYVYNISKNIDKQNNQNSKDIDSMNNSATKNDFDLKNENSHTESDNNFHLEEKMIYFEIPGVISLKTRKWMIKSYRCKITFLDSWKSEFLYLILGNGERCLHLNSLLNLENFVELFAETYSFFEFFYEQYQNISAIWKNVFFNDSNFIFSLSDNNDTMINIDNLNQKEFEEKEDKDLQATLRKSTINSINSYKTQYNILECDICRKIINLLDFILKNLYISVEERFFIDLINRIEKHSVYTLLGELENDQEIDQNIEQTDNNVLQSSQYYNDGQKNEPQYENIQNDNTVPNGKNLDSSGSNMKIQVSNENVVQRIASFKSFNEFQKRHHLSDLLILSESQEVKVQNLRKTGSIQRISQQSSEEFDEPLVVNHGFLSDSDDDLDYSTDIVNNSGGVQSFKVVNSNHTNTEKIIKKSKSGNSEELNLSPSNDDNNSEEIYVETKNKHNNSVITEISEIAANSTPKSKKRLTRKRSMSLSSFNPIEGVFILKNNGKKDEINKIKQLNQPIFTEQNQKNAGITNNDHKETKNIVVSSVEIIKTPKMTTTTSTTTTTKTQTENSSTNQAKRNTTTLFWKRRNLPTQNIEKSSNSTTIPSSSEFSLFKNGAGPLLSFGTTVSDTNSAKINNSGTSTSNSMAHLVKKNNHRAKQIRNVVESLNQANLFEQSDEANNTKTMDNDDVQSVAANVFAANSPSTVFYSDSQLAKQREIEFSNTLDKQQQRLFTTNSTTTTDVDSKKISSLEKTGSSLPVSTVVVKKKNDTNGNPVSSSSSSTSSFIKSDFKNIDTPRTLFTMNRKVVNGSKTFEVVKKTDSPQNNASNTEQRKVIYKNNTGTASYHTGKQRHEATPQQRFAATPYIFSNVSLGSQNHRSNHSNISPNIENSGERQKQYNKNGEKQKQFSATKTDKNEKEFGDFVPGQLYTSDDHAAYLKRKEFIEQQQQIIANTTSQTEIVSNNNNLHEQHVSETFPQDFNSYQTYWQNVAAYYQMHHQQQHHYDQQRAYYLQMQQNYQYQQQQQHPQNPVFIGEIPLQQTMQACPCSKCQTFQSFQQQQQQNHQPTQQQQHEETADTTELTNDASVVKNCSTDANYDDSNEVEKIFSQNSQETTVN